MQSIANGLRAASRRQCQSFLPLHAASTSQVQWMARRTSMWSTLDWMRSSLQAKERKQESEEAIQAAREKAKESGTANLFDYDVAPVSSETSGAVQRAKPSKHDCRTRIIRISHRKLNKLANQIAGKPIDTAVLQMRFSEKRVSERIRLLLEQAKRTAVQRGMDKERLVVSEAWVNKATGGRMAKRMEFKGRGRLGIQTKYKAKMVVSLREGLTFEEQRQKDREARLKRVVSSGLVREDVPLRNVGPQWTW